MTIWEGPSKNNAPSGFFLRVEPQGAKMYTGEHYKRVPRGFDPNHQRTDQLRHNSLYTCSRQVAARYLGSPELVDKCFEHFSKIAPLHHWLERTRSATA